MLVSPAVCGIHGRTEGTSRYRRTSPRKLCWSTKGCRAWAGSRRCSYQHVCYDKAISNCKLVHPCFDVEYARGTLPFQTLLQLKGPGILMLDIHAAPEERSRIDALHAKVVEMRNFAGMKDAEMGVALGLTDRTVWRVREKLRLTQGHILQR